MLSMPQKSLLVCFKIFCGEMRRKNISKGKKTEEMSKTVKELRIMNEKNKWISSEFFAFSNSSKNEKKKLSLLRIFRCMAF
jgi:hypothetical protein